MELSRADHSVSPPNIEIPREYNAAHDLLERNMRVTELDFHQQASGAIHHRVEVPRNNPRKGQIPVADGQCGAVLKAYRDNAQLRNQLESGVLEDQVVDWLLERAKITEQPATFKEVMNFGA